MNDGGRGADESENPGQQSSREEFLNRLIRHDITNNLLVIQGNVELLADQLTDPTAIDRLETVQHQTDAALGLLDETKSQLNGTRGAATETVDTASTIETELGQIEAAYPEATINVEASGSIAAEAPAFLGSIFSNLLRNAIVHNDTTHPRVDVTITVDSESIELAITDNGPGIPEDVRSTLTNPSARDDSGMGLYLVHSLVEEHDGTLSIDSGEHGTTVTVTLPRKGGSIHSSSSFRFPDSTGSDSIEEPIRPDESPTFAICRAVAESTKRDIEDLEPLSNAIDPEAIETILRDGAEASVTFQYEGFEIEVTPEEICLSPHSSS